jgi:LysR family transcriptional regulator, benzoate and cis,cis-muconate-responsive activator of ben and cat genes
MELRHIRYFLALARQLNFTAAAMELHISQPPLSRQIKDLEEELGIRLFERNSAHVALSPAGAFLAGEFSRIVEEIKAAIANAQAVGKPENAPLRIACVNSHISALLPALLEYASTRLPGRKVKVSMMTTEAQRAALQAGSIDLGIVRSWKASPGLSFSTLIEEPFAIVFPHAWTQESDLPGVLEDLSGQPMAVLSGSSAPGLSEFARRACAAAGFEPNAVFESSDMNALLKLVAASLAWSIVPALSFANGNSDDWEGPRAFRAVMMENATELGFCWKDGYLSPDASAFVEIARDFVEKRLPGMIPGGRGRVLAV